MPERALIQMERASLHGRAAGAINEIVPSLSRIAAPQCPQTLCVLPLTGIGGGEWHLKSKRTCVKRPFPYTLWSLAVTVPQKYLRNIHWIPFWHSGLACGYIVEAPPKVAGSILAEVQKFQYSERTDSSQVRFTTHSSQFTQFYVANLVFRPKKPLVDGGPDCSFRGGGTM